MGRKKKNPTRSPEEAQSGGIHVYHLVGDINEENTLSLSRFFLKVRAAGKDPILLIITSDGGDLDCALALYDLMRNMRNRITTVAAGNADSAATLVYLGGDERRIMKNAAILLHDPATTFQSDESLDVKATRRLLSRIEMAQKKLLKILHERTKMPLKLLEKFCSATTEITAEEAVRYGFAHKIVRSVRKYKK